MFRIIVGLLVSLLISSNLWAQEAIDLPDSTSQLTDTVWTLVEDNQDGQTFFALEPVERKVLVNFSVDLDSLRNWIVRQNELFRQGKIPAATFKKMTDVRIVSLDTSRIAEVGIIGQYQGATDASPSNLWFNWQEGFGLNRDSPDGKYWSRDVIFQMFMRKHIPADGGPVEITDPVPIVFKVLIRTTDGKEYWTCHPEFTPDDDGGNWNSILPFNVDAQGKIFGKTKVLLR